VQTYRKCLIIISHSQVRSCSAQPLPGSDHAPCLNILRPGNVTALASNVPGGGRLPRVLVTAHVSAQDFLNGVCTHIIWLTKKKLTYYTGNYDTFRKTVRENEVIQTKKYAKEQDDIKHLKEFIASCGTYSNLVKQARALSCVE